MASAKRGRFGNVVHMDDVPAEAWARETGRFGLEGREVAVELGAEQLGYCVVSLDPGRASCPYHFHHGEEELFHVLSGVGVLRQGDEEGEEELELRAGDFVSFPAGTGIAHQFLNRSEAPFVYLAVSNRVPSDACEYPDSNKVLLRRSRKLMERGEPRAYFDGERGGGA
jgi:uncharacterized cupin superfamily protein